MRKRVFETALIMVFIGLMLAAVSGAQAQGETREDFTLNGVTHTLIYPAGITVVDATKQVLTDALPVYNRLFAMNDLSIQITFHTTPGGRGLLADASPEMDAATPTDCTVNVYNHADNGNPTAFKFTLAHELSHCYQFKTRRDPAAVFGRRGDGSDPNGWWIEGTAEWLASKVYAPAGALSERTIRDTYTDMNINLYEPTLNYSRYWFFVYYARVEGDAAVIELIRNISPDPATHNDYLAHGGTIDRVFSLYGRVVIGKELAGQPDYARAADVTHVAIPALPGHMSDSTDPLSVKVIGFDVPAVAPEHGIEMTVTGLSAGHYSVGLLLDVNLRDGESYTFCGTQLSSTLYVALSRGDDNSGNFAHFNFAEADCLPDPPDCVVGVWSIVEASWPAPPGSPPVFIDYLDSFVEFRPDGKVISLMHWLVTTKLPTGEVLETEITLAGRGGAIVGEQPDGTLKITALNQVTDPGTLFVTINGSRQDMSSMLRGIQTGFFGGGNAPPAVATCAGNTLTYATTSSLYNGLLPDNTMRYTFSRVGGR